MTKFSYIQFFVWNRTIWR